MGGVGEPRGAAPHVPTRSSAPRSSRCEPPCSASSPTWIHARCCMLLRSAETGVLWLATPQCGHGCCLRMPVSVPRYLSLSATPARNLPFSQQKTWALKVWPLQPSALASLPHSALLGPPDLGLVSLQPAKLGPLHPLVTLLSLQFLAMLAQWCTQAHSLTLQNLKPRQRGKKESKEEYARSTR